MKWLALHANVDGLEWIQSLSGLLSLCWWLLLRRLRLSTTNAHVAKLLRHAVYASLYCRRHSSCWVRGRWGLVAANGCAILRLAAVRWLRAGGLCALITVCWLLVWDLWLLLSRVAIACGRLCAREASSRRRLLTSIGTAPEFKGLAGICSLLLAGSSDWSGLLIVACLVRPVVLL